ncbi:23S rRNA (guanosine(2251)-2'-O)-methyltransferase RlmB [Christiangramia forsetii]|uniref:TrmH family tRNA/rRNA methyltransferase n=2 Tax=Christiangramia forsetii TaxID=411153 RepID=A0M5B1_CHRFK|nr:23S rRNA (guanosine(2251)-2'-O)-methyltransferase RlmB [Christiangramia forsetii]GGG21395.1 23S rRNA (guanosine(2251)-2'-O)-methyltransferase RlmB [Christiangramia forsetii]CAL67806.1 TrmH family tRNA/rRNA methyltransferase [Christiangramia forsetii KT0803]
MEETTRIFGIRTVIEAIDSKKDIEKVFIQKDLSGPLFKELNRNLKEGNYNISYVPVEKLNKLSKNGNHQGVVANISPIGFVSLEKLVEDSQKSSTTPLFVLLDGITDVRNFGAIIRTAECCGVTGIIIQEKGSAPINADTVKTSAGAVFNIPICKVNHIKDAVFHLQTYDIKLIAATEKTDDVIFDIDLKQPIAIIMGDEAKGISNSILKSVDYKAKLPMLGSIASLNVSVACGAFLYEAVRQRI